ncbi:MAG: hypothetical protein ACREQR_02730 [Candidatus Binataceae bacterium]
MRPNRRLQSALRSKRSREQCERACRVVALADWREHAPHGDTLTAPLCLKASGKL